MKFKLNQKQITLLLVLFASFISYSQIKTITGTIADTLNVPLQNANIIAKPYQPNQQLKFAIADHKGRYKLELEKNVKYEITASYLGYKEEAWVVPSYEDIFINCATSGLISYIKGKTIKQSYEDMIAEYDKHIKTGKVNPIYAALLKNKMALVSIINNDDKTIESIDTKWDKLGLGSFLPSPSLKFKSQMYGDEAVVED